MTILQATEIVFKDLTVLKIDATISQGHERTSSVTEHPVESGGKVNDHVIRDSKKLSLSGYFSASPMRFNSNAINASTENAKPEVDGTRHTQAYNRIEKAWNDSEVLIIRTRVQEYKNMVITSFSRPVTPDIGDSVEFSLSLTQIVFAITKKTKVPKENVKNTKPSNTPTVNNKNTKKMQQKVQTKDKKGVSPKTPTPKKVVKYGGAGGGTNFSPQLDPR